MKDRIQRVQQRWWKRCAAHSPTGSSPRRTWRPRGAYTTVGTYDHRELLALVTCLSRKPVLPPTTSSGLSGRHLAARFSALYPAFSKASAAPFDFLGLSNSTSHVRYANSTRHRAARVQYQTEPAQFDGHGLPVTPAFRRSRRGPDRGLREPFAERITITQRRKNGELHRTRFPVAHRLMVTSWNCCSAGSSASAAPANRQNRSLESLGAYQSTNTCVVCPTNRHAACRCCVLPPRTACCWRWTGADGCGSGSMAGNLARGHGIVKDRERLRRDVRHQMFALNQQRLSALPRRRCHLRERPVY